MTDNAAQITKQTTIAIGFVISLVVTAFYIGGEHNAVQMRLDQHDQAFVELRAGMRRLEKHFGTLPPSQGEASP